MLAVMKNKRITCLSWLCLISILYQGNGFAQVSKDTLKNCPIKNFVKTVGGDLLHVASSPLRLSKNGGFRLLILTTITAGFVARVDSPIDEEFGIEIDDAYWLPAQGLARIGEVYDRISPKRFSTALSIAMLTGGLVFKDKKFLETTRLMVESSLITQFITTWSKDLFGRSRPYTGKGPHHFEFFCFQGRTRIQVDAFRPRQQRFCHNDRHCRALRPVVGKDSSHCLWRLCGIPEN